MDILACRSEENSYNILPSAATMLFHGLPGGDVHGVVEEMERRGKSEGAISSAIDMEETETVGDSPCPCPLALCPVSCALCRTALSLQPGLSARWLHLTGDSLDRAVPHETQMLGTLDGDVLQEASLPQYQLQLLLVPTRLSSTVARSSTRICSSNSMIYFLKAAFA